MTTATGRSAKTLATVGYEATTAEELLGTLRHAGVDLVIDVRAVARSRRPGFAKSRLAAALASAGIEYLHLAGLGTPAEGRAAARAGRYDRMRTIFLDHLETPAAVESLERALELVAAGRRICLLCLEAVPEHCHRSLVADRIATRIPVAVEHLDPRRSEPVAG